MLKGGVKMVTKTEKRNKLDEKIRAYRFLFKEGNLEPNEENVNEWLSYNYWQKRKKKPENLKQAIERVEEKESLYRKLDLWKRVKKLHNYLRKYSSGEDFIVSPQKPTRQDGLIKKITKNIEKANNVYELRNYKNGYASGNVIRHEARIVSALIQSQIISKNQLNKEAFLSLTREFQLTHSIKPTLEDCGFTEKEPTEKEFEDVCDSVRMGKIFGIETPYRINEPITRKSHYSARSELRKLDREKQAIK